MTKYLKYIVTILFIISLIGLYNQERYKGRIKSLESKNTSYREYLLRHVNFASNFSLDTNITVQSEEGNKRLRDFLLDHKDFLFLRVNSFGCEACLESFLKSAYNKKLDKRICLLIQSRKMKDIRILSSKYNNRYPIIGCESFIRKIDSIPYSYAFTIGNNLNINNVFFPEYDKPQFIDDYLEFVK